MFQAVWVLGAGRLPGAAELWNASQRSAGALRCAKSIMRKPRPGAR